MPLMAAIGFACVVPVRAGADDRVKAQNDLNQAKSIQMAIMMYAAVNNDRTPPNLEALVPDYLPTRANLASPLATGSNVQGYELLLPDTDLNTVTDKTALLLRGRHKARDGLRSHVYVNGSAELKRD